MTRESGLHNPFGLVHGTPWLGLADEQPDPDFCAFIDDFHGLRAGMLNFLGMEPLHGLTTVSECITRASPPASNPTPQYIANVCEWSGLTPDAPIRQALMPFFKGVIRQENGPELLYPDPLMGQALTAAEDAL